MRVLVAVLLFASLAVAGPAVFDGTEIHVRLCEWISSGSTCWARETFTAGPGLELDNFGGLFDVELHGNLVDIILIDDWTPPASTRLEFFWHDQGIYINTYPLTEYVAGEHPAYTSQPEGFSINFVGPHHSGEAIYMRAYLDDGTTAALPEPATLTLFGVGLIGLLGRWKIQRGPARDGQ